MERVTLSKHVSVMFLRLEVYFSNVDLYWSYWQVEVDSADIDKTAFVTREGLVHFTLC